MKRPALEAAFSRACGNAPEYCQVCRAPLSEERGFGGVELFDGEQLGTCSACGREVDRYFPKMKQLGKDAVRLDLAAFRAYYFDHNDDTERLSRITTFLDRSP